MRFILIPVKDLTSAKQRLSPVMTQLERTRLAHAMLEHTFRVVSEVRTKCHFAVVTSYSAAIELAEQYAFTVIPETVQVSESVSVDYGSRELEARGATAVLRLPIDLPLVRPEDIDEIWGFDQGEGSLVIVPSRDGTGTNAILRRPPTLFPSHFGPGSLAKHLEEAELIGAQVTISTNVRLGLDIDEPDDLRELMTREDDSTIRDLLVAMNIMQR